MNLLSTCMNARGLPLLVCIGGIAVSLAFDVLIYPRIAGQLTANLDPDRIGELASNIYQSGAFVYGSDSVRTVTFDRGPVYPYLVASVYCLTGTDRAIGVHVMQAVLHGLCGVFLFSIGQRVFDRRIGLVAQSIHAMHPILVWYTARIWIETTHTMLVTATVLALTSLAYQPNPRKILIAGIALGVTVLTKSVLLLLPFPLVVYALLRRNRSFLLATGSATLVATLIVVPWTLRNFSLSGHFVPVHTSLGLNLYQGEAISRNWLSAPFSTADLWSTGHSMSDSVLAPLNVRPESPEGDSALIRSVFSDWTSHPELLLQHVTLNALTFWYLAETPIKSFVVITLQLPLLILAGWRLTFVWRRYPASHVAIITFFYFWVLHGFIVGWVRYSVPILPLLILLSVAATGSSGPGGSSDGLFRK